MKEVKVFLNTVSDWSWAIAFGIVVFIQDAFGIMDTLNELVNWNTTFWVFLITSVVVKFFEWRLK